MRCYLAIMLALGGALASTGCGEAEERDGNQPVGTGGAQGQGGTFATGGTPGAGGIEGPGGSGGTGGAGGSVEESDMRLLTPHLVGYVNARAVEEARTFLRTFTGGVPLTTRRFFEAFPDDFDFIYVLVDATEGAVGMHLPVNRPEIPGTGITWSYSADDEFGHGSDRLRSVIAMRQTGGPPHHETMHHWAAYLRDPSLGFGIGDDRSHWGWAGVNGALGGFDPKTLRCLEPADAEPPCTPQDGGSTTYVIDSFGTNVNWRGYGDLELYLMGVLDAEEIEPIPVLRGVRNAEVVSGKRHVTADALDYVTIDDIIGLYGRRAPAAPEDRAFRGAFVLVTEEPPTQEAIEAADAWARSFGCENPEDSTHCFNDMARHLATMDTRIEH